MQAAVHERNQNESAEVTPQVPRPGRCACSLFARRSLTRDCNWDRDQQDQYTGAWRC